MMEDFEISYLGIGSDNLLALGVAGVILGQMGDYAPRVMQANTSQTPGMHHAKIAAQATMAQQQGDTCPARAVGKALTPTRLIRRARLVRRTPTRL